MAVFKFKEIKPKKLNDKAMRKVFLDAVRESGQDILKDFRKTTKTWSHKPHSRSCINSPEVLCPFWFGS